jgi:hypothetical protein
MRQRVAVSCILRAKVPALDGTLVAFTLGDTGNIYVLPLGKDRNGQLIAHLELSHLPLCEPELDEALTGRNPSLGKLAGDRFTDGATFA